jgi:hypothetical protein
MRHGKYWELIDGQTEGRMVDSGYRTKEEAERQVKSLLIQFRSRAQVELLRTLEHDLRSDDPNFDPSQRFESARWCITFLE